MKFFRLNPKWSGSPRAFDEPACFIFNSLEEMMATYQVTHWEPEIDFGRYVVVSFHRGLCRSGGYLARILRVVKTGRVITVRVGLRDPGPGEFVTLVLTHPYDMVQIPRDELGPGKQRQQLLFRFVDSKGKEMCRREISID